MEKQVGAIYSKQTLKSSTKLLHFDREDIIPTQRTIAKSHQQKKWVYDIDN